MNNEDLTKNLSLLEQLSRTGANIAVMLSSAPTDRKQPTTLHESAAAMASQLSALHWALLGVELAPVVKEYTAARVEWKQQLELQRQEKLEEWKKTEAPKVWQAWHRRALVFAKGGNDDPFIQGIQATIPCGDCKQHFAQLLSDDVPVWTANNFDYFAYTVEIHNQVNEKLGKSVMTLEDARKLYAGG